MTVLMFALFFGLMLFGVPIAAAIGLAIFSFVGLSGDVTFGYLARSTVTALDSFPVLAVPMFILAGEIMGKGGISKRLVDFANACVGGLTGGLAMTVVLTCILFGAISGSGPATFAAVGAIMIPLMVKQGYDKCFVTGLAATAGGLGVLIPPSLPMVMYGIISTQSIGDMFLAGVIPGIISGIALMVYCYIYCKRNPPVPVEEVEKMPSLWQSIKEGFWALLSPVIILGGIYTGLFTPTEAAAVSIVYGIIVSKFIYKTITFKEIPAMLFSAARVNAPVLLIVAIATVFGRILGMYQIPTLLAEAVLSVSSNPVIILILINLLLLVAGMLMETLAAITILTPILLPICTAIGMDPIHFGVMMVANLAIGFVTPPIGVSLYTAASLTGLPIAKIAKAAIGPIIALLVALVLIILIEPMSTFLPNLLQ